MNFKLGWIAVLSLLSTVACSCDPGFYSHEGSCLPCPAGTYQPESGQNGCKPCPSGEFQPGTAATSCMECGPNSMPNADSSECDCKPGSARNSTLDQCILCPAGTRYIEPGEYSYYSLYSVDEPRCDPCREGTYQSNIGQSECITCPPRSFSESGATNCTVCPHGQAPIEPPYLYTYSYTEIYSYEERVTMCGTCDPGREYKEYISSCSLCADMYFKAEEGLEPCAPCPPDTSSTEDRTACTPCEPGTAIMPDGTCGKCPAGTFYSTEEPYYYYLQPTPAPEESFCHPCRIGTFSNYENVMPQCFTCAGHSFSGLGATECIKCPQNQVLMSNGSCATCEPGTFYDERLMECVECGRNSYTRNINERYCRSCPKNSYSYEGSYSCTPVTCPEDTIFVHQTGKCGVCPPGTETSYTTSPFCHNCSVGYVKPLAGNTYCTYCGFGTTSNEDFTQCVVDPDADSYY